MIGISQCPYFARICQFAGCSQQSLLCFFVAWNTQYPGESASIPNVISITSSLSSWESKGIHPIPTFQAITGLHDPFIYPLRPAISWVKRGIFDSQNTEDSRCYIRASRSEAKKMPMIFIPGMA